MVRCLHATLLAMIVLTRPAIAAEDGAGAGTSDEAWAIHGQATFVQQLQPAFRSPYAGAQSLPGDANGRETFDATLYLGYRPWRGGEVWFNPEIDQGFGLGSTYGVAGYLTGEAFKAGAALPYYKMSRAFFRQTIDLGGDVEAVAPDLNQLGGSRSADRVVLTFGKLSVVDLFDTNAYAHAQRSDFLNWSVLDAGSFDYAADAWGQTYGAAVEWVQDWWTVRAGLFDLSQIPNGGALSLPLLQQTQGVGELEERHTLFGQPGRLKFLYWLTRGNLATYADALALAAATGSTPATLPAARYRSKYGVVVNLEQQINPGLGLFARAGWTQPGVQQDDYTDIMVTFQLGLQQTGARWGRPEDRVGLALVENQLSHSAKIYLAAGGLGGLIGDGRLPAAGPEQIVESYYSLAVAGLGAISADGQFVNNPAYNRQRGPVLVFALRLHSEF